MSTKKLSAVIQIGGALDGSLANSIGKGSKAIGKLGDAIRQLGREQEKLSKLDKLDEQLKKDSAATGKAFVKLQQLRREVENTNGKNKQLNASLKAAEQNLYRLSAAEGATKGKLLELRTQLKAAGHDVDNLAKANRRLGDAMKNLGGRRSRLMAMDERKSELQSRQGDLMGPFLGATAVMASAIPPVQEAIKYQSELADIRKTVGGTTQETRALGDSLREMSLVMPVSREEVMQVAALAGQAGIASGEIKEYTRDALMLGKAFGLTSEEGSDALQSFRAGLKLTQKDSILLADAINLLGNNFEGVVSERALTDFIQRQGATLNAAGLKPNQIAGLGAALLAPGTAPEVAATGAKNMTNALTKGEAATKGQRWAMSLLGLDPINLSKAMQKDAPKTIISTLEKISKQPKFRQSAIVSKLFGEESKGAIMPLLTNTGSLIKAFNSVAHETQYAGSMLQEYKNQTEQAGARVQILGNSLNDLKLTLGDQLLGTFDQLATSLIPVVQGIGLWATENPRLSKTIMMVLGGVATATAIFTGFGYIMNGVQLAAIALGTTLGPVGWTMIGLGAIAGVIAANWDKIGPVFNRAGQAANEVFAWFGQKFPWVTGLFKGTWELIKTSFFNYNPLGIIIKNWSPMFNWLMDRLGVVGDMIRWVINPGSAQMPTLVERSAPTPSKGNNVVPMPTGRGGTTYNDNSKLSIVVHPGGNLDKAAADSLLQQLKREQAKKRRGGLND